MEKVIEKIQKIRKDRGFSHEYMAHMLDISQVAYSKIEKNETRLTLDRLYKIAEILDSKIEEILEIKADKIYNQDLKDNSIGSVEILHQENKELTEQIIQLYEKRISEKDELISYLKFQIEGASK
jgi:transcriptional regulator with XRE-family HTH domain